MTVSANSRGCTSRPLWLAGCSSRIDPTAFMLLTVVVGQLADLLGFDGLLLELVGQLHHPVEYALAHRVVLTVWACVIVYLAYRLRLRQSR